MIKILLADRNAIFREGLSTLFQREPDIQVVGEADSISQALQILEITTPDLILLDAELPDIDAFHEIQRLRIIKPVVKIILHSTCASEEQLLSAFWYGACGYTLKNQSFSVLLESIRALQRGEVVIPHTMAGGLLDELPHLSHAGTPDIARLLTTREVEVLRELSKGYSNHEIAIKLEIAENTVKVHVHNILKKLNLPNRRETARLVLK